MTTRCECGQPSVLPKHEQKSILDNYCAGCKKKEELMHRENQREACAARTTVHGREHREPRMRLRQIRIACDKALGLTKHNR